MRPFAWIAVLALAGCAKRAAPAPPPARLVALAVVDKTPADDRPAPVDVGALEARAAEAMRAGGALPVALGTSPNAGVDYRLKVEVRVEGAEVEDRGVMRAFVEARLARIGGAIDEPPITDSAVAERVYQRKELGDRAVAFRAHLERAVDDLLKALSARVKIHTGGAAALTAGLRDPDPELRGEAVRVAAEHKERVAVPALIELLKGEDARLRDRALGALVEIGDRRAVKPITEAVHFRDLTELPKVIDAVGSLGGDEAHAYLEFVAGGHDDPEVQRLAKEALARMDRRGSLDPPANGR